MIIVKCINSLKFHHNLTLVNLFSAIRAKLSYKSSTRVFLNIAQLRPYFPVGGNLWPWIAPQKFQQKSPAR